MTYVGQDIPHESAAQHVTGRSSFIDDIPPRQGELFLEIVRSRIAAGRILSLDLQQARQHPGVVAVLSAQDIPGSKVIGPIVADEPLLADCRVQYVGEPVGIVAATSRIAAIEASRLARMETEKTTPVLSIQQAMEAGSFLGGLRRIERGSPDAEYQAAELRIHGELRIDGQEHFYLESQAAIAYPGEAQTMHVVSSTQHPTEVQAIVAEVLGWPFSCVVVESPRMGGGFGGKETQAAQPAAFAALVAARTGRPARIVLGRDEDMLGTGKRHPFLVRYQVGFSRMGMIQSLIIELYSDGGCSTDLSPSVLERAMLHVDNAYFLANVRITGRVCRTNFPSNTAFRGFGGPQGVAAIENIIEEIAHEAQLDSLDVRLRNCYQVERCNTTPYGQLVDNNVLPRLLQELRETSSYDDRVAAIRVQNESERECLRSIALTPIKFGISFTKTTLNQANALINIYLDGSVLVSTGATEMGQGVQTRIRQLVADELGLDYAAIRIGSTRTDKNHNTSPTAASCGTDLNGAAAMDAASRLRHRLASFAAGKYFSDGTAQPSDPATIVFAQGNVFSEQDPQHVVPFRDVVQAAYLDRISLGERGFYATPSIGWDRDAGVGRPFAYFTNGAAVAEVKINRFTGELSVIRVDLLMDVGNSINPGIDRGQITGGFVQGMGWVTTESLTYDSGGELLSHSPTTYKIPNISDVPPDFRVHFFHNQDRYPSLKGSKAVGEPPLMLGISVWAAIRRAIISERNSIEPRLAIPATHERILLGLLRPIA